MNNIVKINDVELTPIEYRGVRVMTLAMMDTAHKRPEGTARRNYNENKIRLIEGEDYFVRNSSEAREMGFVAPNGLVLLTETGYSMLVKSFTDDLAWDVQRQLVRSYFKRADAGNGKPRSLGTDPALSAFRQSRAIASSAKVAESICAMFPDLGAASKQTIYAKLVNAAAGQDVVPLPAVEKLWSATEVGKKFKVSANAIGKLANAHGLKVDQYGTYAMDKSQHSEKQMPSFRYNAAGVARIGELLSTTRSAAPAQQSLALPGGAQ